MRILLLFHSIHYDYYHHNSIPRMYDLIKNATIFFFHISYIIRLTAEKKKKKNPYIHSIENDVIVSPCTKWKRKKNRTRMLNSRLVLCVQLVWNRPHPHSIIPTPYHSLLYPFTLVTLYILQGDMVKNAQDFFVDEKSNPLYYFDPFAATTTICNNLSSVYNVKHWVESTLLLFSCFSVSKNFVHERWKLTVRGKYGKKREFV